MEQLKPDFDLICLPNVHTNSSGLVNITKYFEKSKPKLILLIRWGLSHCAQNDNLALAMNLVVFSICLIDLWCVLHVAHMYEYILAYHQINTSDRHARSRHTDRQIRSKLYAMQHSILFARSTHRQPNVRLYCTLEVYVCVYVCVCLDDYKF